MEVQAHIFLISAMEGSGQIHDLGSLMLGRKNFMVYFNPGAGWATEVTTE
jgi:hypothetical protein